MTDNYNTYLINLDRSPERLEKMKKEFAKCGMNFIRVQAVDSNHLDESKFVVKNRYKRKLVPGEIGCFMSHVKVLKLFLKSDAEFAVIIEDDIILHDNFKVMVEESISAYSTLPQKHHWDILKLYNGKRRNIKVADVNENYIIGACGVSLPVGTVAAIFTRQAAEKFLAGSGSEVTTIKRPIDCELQYAWKYDLRIYNLLPSIITLIKGKTEIHVDGRPKSNRWKQLREEVLKFFPKHLYLINQHGFKAYYNSFIAKKNPKIS